MRPSLLVPFLAAVLLGVTHAASAQSGLYIGGSTGALLREDSSRVTTIFNNVGLTSPGTDTTRYDPGPQVNIALGYRLPFGFRIEGELGYANYQTDSTAPLSIGGVFPQLNGSFLPHVSGGDHNLMTASANAFYDVRISDWFQPYIGGGFGYFHGTASDGRFAMSNGALFTQLGKTADGPLVLAEVGLSLRIDPSWWVVPAYRFEHLFVPGAGPDVNAHVLKLGLRYTF
jgi:opacity protein-like surface antigen